MREMILKCMEWYRRRGKCSQWSWNRTDPREQN